jgi:histidyl-tRNA synthetase
LVIEVSRAIIGITGMRDVTVLVSSVGDQESKRRFARELVNFFRKRNGDLPLELRHEAARDPERTYQMLDERNDPLIADTPHRIDHLSENSRKVMLDTLALFESTSIPYAIEPRLPANPNEHAELLFALEASDRRGNRIKVAAGGRFDEYLKRAGRDEAAVAISISVPSHIEPEAVDQAPMCFVVHVGDVAKLKLFLILRGLWESELLIGQILMLGTLREQMDAARARGAHYIAIVGQREALDGTVIVRNVATQLQTVIPAGKLVSYLEHKT